MKMSDVLTHDEINHRGWLDLALTGDNSDSALNAAYIAVRNHDKLVEALEVARKSLATYGDHPIVFDRIDSALKQAKGAN